MAKPDPELSRRLLLIHSCKKLKMMGINKHILLIFISIIKIFLISNCSKTEVSHNIVLPKLILFTELGNITVEIDTIKAPLTAANFLKYVDENRLKNASFYRVVRLDNQPEDSIKIEVIQGGLGFDENSLRLSPIRHETTKETGILHKDGVLSMARSNPGTASSEIFICIGDQPELDFGGRRNPDGQGFAAFGRVSEGMDVVKKIQSKSSNEQMLLTPVEIIDIVRIKTKAGEEK